VSCIEPWEEVVHETKEEEDMLEENSLVEKSFATKASKTEHTTTVDNADVNDPEVSCSAIIKVSDVATLSTFKVETIYIFSSNIE
jgi:hypothetical protein